jgi:Tol biopolymer transport system component
MPINLTSMRRVSTNAAGEVANSGSFEGSFSPSDSDVIVFTSSATNLVAADFTSDPDVFIKNIATGHVAIVSVRADGRTRDGFSSQATISPDGTEVAFASAEALVDYDVNGRRDIYISDLAGSLEVVGYGSGSSAGPTFSPDGRSIAFVSTSRLASSDGGSKLDIYIVNARAGAPYIHASVAQNGGPANGESFDPVFSSDGTRLLFRSNATNLVPGDTNRRDDIFIRDLTTDVTTRVSTTASGDQANGDSYFAAFAPDGSKVVFVSNATNLVTGDTNGIADMFIKDLVTGAVIRINPRMDGGQAISGFFYSPVFSPDGMKVAFASTAGDLVPGDVGGNIDIFIKNLLTGAIQKVTQAIGGANADGDSSSFQFSADGRRLLIESTATNLVSDSPSRYPQYYVVDLTDGGAGDDRLLGLGGEIVRGGDGDDTLTSSTSGDTLVGGRGDDRLEGSIGADTYRFRGLFGDDVVTGGGGADQLVFEGRRAAFADVRVDGLDLVIEIAGQTVRLLDHAAPGTQRIETAVFDDGTIDLTDPTAFTRFRGTPGDDVLIGTAIADTIAGLAGHDTIDGQDGDDVLDGGPGNDVVRGGRGDDVITGGRGDDTLRGGENADRVDGGDGDDLIEGGSGDDRLLGRAGDDVVRGGDGDDVIDGGTGTDRLEGEGGDDEIRGGAGSDTLAGGDGDDVLIGNDGSFLEEPGVTDFLDGGAGDDRLLGYGGATTYLFDAGFGQDEIREYGTAADLIRLGPGLRLAGLRLARDGDDLTITVAGTGDSIRIVDQFDPSGLFAVETLETGDGTRIALDDPVIPLTLGAAPESPPRDDPGAWQRAWTLGGVTIEHKADGGDPAEPWTRADFGTASPGTLAGSDIARGDLGVSGVTAATGAVPQEIDGTEALRLDFGALAVNRVELHLTSLFARENGTEVFEAGRLRAFAADGTPLGETVFHATSLDGRGTAVLANLLTIASVVIDAGAYDAGGTWRPGAWVDAAGAFAGAPAGPLGSDFLIDRVDLEVALIG